jgi:hypothetical protein
VTSSTASGNANDGIVVNGAGASIKSSSASRNANSGIAVGGSAASIGASTASGNGGEGVDVFGNSAVLKGNHADANGFAGGASDGIGLGIDVTGYTIAPVGANAARGNDDPGECVPAVC